MNRDAHEGFYLADIRPADNRVFEPGELRECALTRLGEGDPVAVLSLDGWDTAALVRQLDDARALREFAGLIGVEVARLRAEVDALSAVWVEDLLDRPQGS